MSSKKSHKFSISPASRPNSEINVTPLVDVVLVLLIIFMVVTPLLEKDIEVAVPQTEQVDTPDEMPQEQLVVGVDAAGQLTLNGEKVAEADYVARLKRVLAAKKAGDKLIFFMPEDTTNYGKLIAALDGAKQAGAETLGMMTEKPEAVLGAPGAPVPPAPPPAK